MTTAETQQPATTEWRPLGAQMSAGVSRRDITPPIGIRTANWGAEGRHEVSTGVHQPITATALALVDAAGDAKFIVSVDLLNWKSIDDEMSIRGPAIEALGIDPSALMLHLVHTHAGPCTMSALSDTPGGSYIPGYLEEISRTVLLACQDALAGASPCDLTWGTGAYD
ncbi:MAG: hypothetical protein WBP59_03020, partial [Ilumatobacteraceae bacterium]